LIGDEQYKVYVNGSQEQILDNPDPQAKLDKASLWIYRFYDQAATTFQAPPHQNVAERLFSSLRHKVTSDGFNIEDAAVGLYDFIMKIRAGTGAEKVYIVAHSMGGLIARCMIQKKCQQDGRVAAREFVARLFTYGTPHGGIRSAGGVAQWVEATFGPAGSNIFAPELMQGYLDPRKNFGDICDEGWDPQVMPDGLLPFDDIFCLIGTDPADYSWGPRTVMGPQTDGLVHIDNAYVRKAHRAYVHRSHSGAYGEVNSEEGYQNLRRFLFGRWSVEAALADARLPQPVGTSWQLDMRLAIRGVSVVMSEQSTEHWCPIMLADPQPAAGTTLVRTFLLDPADHPAAAAVAARRMRYTVTLRLFPVKDNKGVFDFRNSIEQVPAWSDALIVDVEPSQDDTGLTAYAAWNSTVPGAGQDAAPVVSQLPAGQGQQLTFHAEGGALVTSVALPAAVLASGLLGDQASIRLTVSPRPAQ
jgi:pimeloyl-ACP methyl ester carboxylesterase